MHQVRRVKDATGNESEPTTDALPTNTLETAPSEEPAEPLKGRGLWGINPFGVGGQRCRPHFIRVMGTTVSPHLAFQPTLTDFCKENRKLLKKFHNPPKKRTKNQHDIKKENPTDLGTYYFNPTE